MRRPVSTPCVCPFLRGAGGAGLYPQKVLRTFWGPPKSGPAGAGAGSGVGWTEPPSSAGAGLAGAGAEEGRA